MQLLPSSGGPSLTAAAVACGRAIGVEGVRDDQAVHALPTLAQPVVTVLQQLRALPFGEQASRWLTAGLNLHAALRMAAIDAEVIGAVEDGIGQVVIVGAGLDTRAWRLPELRGSQVIEVDLPATQSRKRRAMADRPSLAALAFVPADLSRDRLEPLLGVTPWQADEPTMWIWEAVAAYLPDAAVRSTARQLADASAPGSRLAMTFTRPIGRGPAGGLFAAAAGLAFRAIGEPILSSYDDFDITALLEEAGFADPQVSGVREWASQAFVTPHDQPFSPERLVVAHAP